MTLAEFLASRSMSRSEFAVAIGVTQATISRYVSGDRMPRVEHLLEIRKFTDGAVTADDFVMQEATE